MGKVNLAVYKGDLGFAIYKMCFLIHEYMYFQIISSLRGLFEEKKIMPKSTTFEIYSYAGQKVLFSVDAINKDGPFLWYIKDGGG